MPFKICCVGSLRIREATLLESRRRKPMTHFLTEILLIQQNSCMDKWINIVFLIFYDKQPSYEYSEVLTESSS